MSCRAGAKRVEAKGVFVGAEVVRGPHWRFGDQDGRVNFYTLNSRIAVYKIMLVKCTYYGASPE